MVSFCSFLPVRRPDKWRRHRCVRFPSGSRCVLAPCLLCVQPVQGAPGGPHLLPPGREDLLRPAPRREAEAALHGLRRGRRTHSTTCLQTHECILIDPHVTVSVELFIKHLHTHGVCTYSGLRTHQTAVIWCSRVFHFNGVSFQSPDLLNINSELLSYCSNGNKDSEVLRRYPNGLNSGAINGKCTT